MTDTQTHASTPYAPPDTPLTILHEDAHIVLADKPSGLLSVPGRGEHLADCLISRLQVVFPSILLVHRLDRDTSGLMVFALTKHAQKDLGQQFEKRVVKKSYLARVHGELAEPSGHINLPLIVDWPNRPLQKVCQDTGRPAQTDWKRLKAGNGESRVRLTPITGRSHQLRVHMQQIGHPILGDPFYATEPARDHPRLMLHAERLRFNHPESGRGQSFSSPAPF
ncbi:MAG: RluA family pseudouridine synthase [Pseudomonadota bacterium]